MSDRVMCICGRSVLPENWQNHLLRQDGGKHGPIGLSLEERLQRAERVCLMYGWTPAGGPNETDREKALYVLWIEWMREFERTGGSMRPKDHPDLSDARIRELAANRDEKRRYTSERIAELVESK